jgi:hypothetical protein
VLALVEQLVAAIEESVVSRVVTSSHTSVVRGEEYLLDIFVQSIQIDVG